jgi:hypothetical protein
MANYVSFKSNRFDGKTVKPHFINPDTGFGEDVIDWVIRNVQHPAITLDKPIQEDYGWGVWASVNSAPYWIAVSINEETIGSDVAEWYMTIVYERGCNPFRRAPPSRNDDLLILCHAMDHALHGDTAITDIRWWQTSFGEGQPTGHPEKPTV